MIDDFSSGCEQDVPAGDALGFCLPAAACHPDFAILPLETQHKWLQRRCEAAATKTGGLPPKILGRVLACCGRFLELLDPEGAEMMERLRQAEAQSVAPMDATEWVSEPSGGWLKAAQAASRGPPKKKKAASRSGTQDAKLGTVFQFGTQAAEPGTVFRFGQNAPT